MITKRNNRYAYILPLSTFMGNGGWWRVDLGIVKWTPPYSKPFDIYFIMLKINRKEERDQNYFI